MVLKHMASKPDKLDDMFRPKRFDELEKEKVNPFALTNWKAKTLAIFKDTDSIMVIDTETGTVDMETHPPPTPEQNPKSWERRRNKYWKWIQEAMHDEFNPFNSEEDKEIFESLKKVNESAAKEFNAASTQLKKFNDFEKGIDYQLKRGFKLSINSLFGISRPTDYNTFYMSTLAGFYPSRRRYPSFRSMDLRSLYPSMARLFSDDDCTILMDEFSRTVTPETSAKRKKKRKKREHQKLMEIHGKKKVKGSRRRYIDNTRQFSKVSYRGGNRR